MLDKHVLWLDSDFEVFLVFSCSQILDGLFTILIYHHLCIHGFLLMILEVAFSWRAILDASIWFSSLCYVPY